MRTDCNRQERMAAKCLHTLLQNKFLFEYGYQNGPVLAKAIVDDILSIVEAHYLPVTDRVPPGTFIATAVSKDAKVGPYNRKLNNCPMVTVKLQLCSREELDDYLSGQVTSSHLLKKRAIRWFYEASQQGGYLTSQDVALLSGVSLGSVSRWVRNYQDKNKTLVPTRGNMHDLGSGVSHKKHIIQLYLQGKLPSEIARQTSHNVRNVSRYIKAFDTVRILRKKHPPLEVIRLSGLSERLCMEYIDICDTIDKQKNMAENRSEEVANL